MRKFKINTCKLIVAFVLLIFSSCEDNNDPELLFEDTPAVRIEKRIAELKSSLQSSENGWKITYFTDDTELGGFTFLFDFISDSEVLMDSDFGTPDVNTASLYDITLGSTIKLTFTTKNVIHELSDSDNYPDEEFVGQGYRGSFEFLYYQTDGDDILFKSNRDRSNIIRFSKATESDWMNLTANNKDMLNNYIPKDPLKSVFRNLILETESNTTLYNFSFNAPRRYATVTAITTDAIESDISFGLAPTPTGFIISPEIDVDGVKLNEFNYDTDTSEFVAENNGVKAILRYESDLNFVLPSYDLGNEPNNSIRLYSTRFSLNDDSESFTQFMDDLRAFFSESLGGRSIQRIYVYNLDSDEPFIQLRYLSGSTTYRQNFPVTKTITEDALGNRIVVFTEIQPGNTHFSRRGFLPFIEYLTRESGFYIQRRGNLNANQKTIGLIAVDDFTLLSHWYDF
ncbi:DUF4302 domain-containing protein [uncultured Polaribacter sp.]|uniref:DUF4302 domain-containing protein n=1 Tax=uncultured Polaribacter sp. TaxID=174711 RepID=UPI00260AF264|nr:DUF4302 domain-containing protein [uncultured Polaribacter sp.]